MSHLSTYPRIIQKMHLITACLVVITLTTLGCSGGPVNNQNCSAGQIKQNGKCVAKQNSSNSGSGNNRVVNNPQAKGDSTNPNILKYDASTATLSYSFTGTNSQGITTAEGENLDKISKSNAGNRLAEIKFVVKPIPGPESDTKYIGFPYWKEDSSGKLITYGVQSTKKFRTSNQHDNRDNRDNNESYTRKYHDCIGLNVREQEEYSVRAELIKDGKNIQIVFLKKDSGSISRKIDTKALKNLQLYLGLKGYTEADILEPTAIPQATDTMHPKTVNIKNFGKPADPADRDTSEKKKSICFNRLFAKQHDSYGRLDPSANDKVFVYKERTYKLKDDETGIKTDLTKTEKAKQETKSHGFAYQKGEALITITMDNTNEVQSATGTKLIKLNLNGAAYLMNSFSETKEEYNGRAAPSEADFINTMNKILRKIAENTPSEDA